MSQRELASHAEGNYALLLLNKFQSILSEAIKTSTQYFESISRPKNDNLRHYTLTIFLYRIIRAYLKICCRIIRTLYWLLAPNMLFNLSVRHIVLFALMFATPSIMRSTIKPCWKWFSYHFLFRIFFGKQWVKQYQSIKKQCADYKTKMTYKEYGELVTKLDEMDGLDAWRINKSSSLYSNNRIQQDLIEITKYLKNIRQHPSNSPMQSDHHHPMRELMQFLRSRIERNYCGITRKELYSVTKIGTKKLIEDYIDNICQSLNYIASNSDDQTITIQEKIVFFQELRHVLGRTALCLSGGGSLGAYHIGVVLALNRNDLLPKIITGSSVGSVVAALVCTKMDEELETLTEDGSLNLQYFDRKQTRSWITGFYGMICVQN